jgi:hypothetical protein
MNDDARGSAGHKSSSTTSSRAGQQIWLGPALTGRAVRLWAGLDRVHVLLDGYRVKTLPSRLDARDLARLAAAGARPAGPPPLPPASGDVIEVERTVNAASLSPRRAPRAGTSGGTRPLTTPDGDAAERPDPYAFPRSRECRWGLSCRA